jgi:hypothetical protein
MKVAREGATATYLPLTGKVLIAGGGNLTDMFDQDFYASAELYDPATGQFTATGSMTSSRADATATLLRNGNVLIAGGQGCSGPKRCTNASASYLVSAEVYDPSTGTFTKTGSMAEVANNPSATLLPDGKVLFDGGLLRAELYDPSTGKFARVGQKAGVVSGYNAATLLLSGKVLVIHADWGGSDLQGKDTEALLYDEKSGKFTTVSLALPKGTPLVRYLGLDVPRSEPGAATLLKDGRVLMFGDGYLETYDPASGKCADAGFISPAAQWYGANATLLADGRVLLSGGSVSPRVTWESISSISDRAVLYDPTDGSVHTSSMQVARGSQTSTLLPDGSVLIAGGDDPDGNHLSSAELFRPMGTVPAAIETPRPSPTPETRPPLTIVATGSMNTERSGATATLLKNGKVLVAGGLGSGDVIHATAELYDPVTGTFAPTGSMSAARVLAAATLLPSGEVLIAGGEGCADPKGCTFLAFDFLTSAELYDPTTGKFAKTGSMGKDDGGETATVLSDGRVLLAAGRARADLYDPASGKFVSTGEEPEFENYYSTATLLPNGKVLVTSQGVNEGPMAQLYDEQSGKFTTVSLALPAGATVDEYGGFVRKRPPTDTATLLKDGRVLLFQDGYLETYDPVSGMCAGAGFISPAGLWGDVTATLLEDGRVLFVRRDEEETRGNITAVLYDPTGGPSRSGTMWVDSSGGMATLLPDGNVLIAGGADATGRPRSASELLKP